MSGHESTTDSENAAIGVPLPLPAALERVAEAVRGVAAGDERIVAVYLFGSQVNGDARPDSDVDLGVLFPRGGSPRLRQLLELQDRFEEAVGKTVDLVDVGRCDAFLALDVIRGERIYCADGLATDGFDLYVLRRAADLAPFERQRRRMLLDPAAFQLPEPAR